MKELINYAKSMVESRPVGYPLPLNEDKQSYADISLFLCFHSSAWKNWQASLSIKDIIPFIDEPQDTLPPTAV